LNTARRPAARTRCQSARGHRHAVPEPNSLILKLLDTINIPLASIDSQLAADVRDLRSVLLADYRHVPGLPSRDLARKLAGIVDNEIKTNADIWERSDEPRSFANLALRFGAGEITVRTAPYRSGSGLSLWGFSCAVVDRGKSKFVIFLNSAHDSGAMAATIGHELGHLIYAHMTGGPCGGKLDQATFTAHLGSKRELFCDSLVALLAYDQPIARRLVRQGTQSCKDHEGAIADEFLTARTMLGSRYRIDLNRDGLSGKWRIRYLISMIHFFKLRCALLDSADV